MTAARVARVNDSGVNNNVVGINDNHVDDNHINTDNNDRIDKPGISKSSVDNVNNSINTSSNIVINNNDRGIDKPSTGKSNSNQGKIGTNSISAKRAKFEEDVKKEPILQTILDVFDGELLG